MYLLRHCESFFNLHFNRDRRDPGIQDPELTPAGHAHASSIAAALQGLEVRHLIISPYTRTLQTATYVLDRLALTARIEQQVRERTAFTCDIGSHPLELARRFPRHDFSHLPARWWHEGIETAEQTEARAAGFRTQMAARSDHAHTLVITHWAFILALTGQSVANGQWIRFDPEAAAPQRIAWP
ncbi:MAG: histidine phosphatase family protein [Sinobacteraceae bacterium]|nr:histidine phosphatase family protein [Nevskiaceae bacterium]MBV8854625.1 histidine phosphatase family protein [Nevskiaceae bacterium]MBV9911659.1 histidine phosphatase family protein [Nevskiaceae bacterium]